MTELESCSSPDSLCFRQPPPPSPIWTDCKLIRYYILCFKFRLQTSFILTKLALWSKRPVQRCFQATLPPQEASATILHAESKNHSKVWIKDSTFSIVFHQSNKVLLWNCSKVPRMWVGFQPEKAVPGSASGKSRRSHGIFVKHSWGS